MNENNTVITARDPNATKANTPLPTEPLSRASGWMKLIAAPGFLAAIAMIGFAAALLTGFIPMADMAAVNAENQAALSYARYTMIAMAVLYIAVGLFYLWMSALLWGAASGYSQTGDAAAHTAASEKLRRLFKITGILVLISVVMFAMSMAVPLLTGTSAI